MKLTIFQKMLVAPAVGMTLYCLYLFAMFAENRQTGAAIETIRDASLPVMELTGENIRLFESIVTQFKDATSAGESEWLDHADRNKRLIEQNLARMKSFNNIVPAQRVDQLQEDFAQYYHNAYELSQIWLDGEADSEQRNRLIENVEHYHAALSRGLLETRDLVHQQVHNAVAKSNQRLNNLLIMGVTIGVVLIFLVLGLTFALSLTTRKSLGELIGRMKALAEGDPDFSQRLVQYSQDELGALVHWFNQLSEKLERDYKKIEQLSITDKLTQLYNRAKIDQLFADELNRAERYGEEFSLILIDMDHFKAVNDHYGHQVGDRVLQEFAERLQNGVRETDYVGRWGGEEFVVIAPGIGAKSAQQLAEKLRSQIIDYSFSEAGHKTASFGVASYRDGDDEKSMVRRADGFLYQAKEAGRNRVVGEEPANPGNG